MEAKNAISNRVISYSKTLQLTLSREPGFDNVGLHVPAGVEWISEQRPSDGAVSTTHSAKFISGLDELFRPFTIDSECHGDQDRTILRIWFNDELWRRPS
jgi:hypothetical protein